MKTFFKTVALIENNDAVEIKQFDSLKEAKEHFDTLSFDDISFRDLEKFEGYELQKIQVDEDGNSELVEFTDAELDSIGWERRSWVIKYKDK